MKENQLTDMQMDSSKVNLLLSFLMMINSTFHFFSGDSQYGVVGIILTAGFFLMDLFAGLIQYHRRAWVALRIFELILFSFCFADVDDLFAVALVALMLLVLMMQLLFSFDYSDIYTRVTSIALSAAPAVISILIVMLVGTLDSGLMFGKACVLVSLTVLSVVMSNIVIRELGKLEQLLFEQRRMVENTKEINENLKQHQEKVKRANAELGVQKIKLEEAYNRINNANTEMILQNEILKQITLVLDVERLLSIMTEILTKDLGLCECAILLMQDTAGNEQPICNIHSNLMKQEEDALAAEILAGCLEPYTVYRGGYVDNHVRPGRYDFLSDDNIGSVLVKSMMRDGKPAVVMLAANEKFDYFTDNQVFFDTIMAQFMIALENAGLYAKVQQMAIRDSLTGIYNRGHLNLMMERFSAQAEKENTPLSVTLFDIDHFKSVNDTYGHLAGDLVIKTIANLANETAKQYHGFAARYGGEEFVLAFPRKDVAECGEIVEQMRSKIAAMELTSDGVEIHVNVSVGITSYPDCCKHHKDLLEHADWAMYYSKKHGRNRVTIDSEEIRAQLGLQKDTKE